MERNRLINRMNKWVTTHYFQLAVFNMILILLFLLHSAGYFHPFFTISINFIVMVALVSSIFLLGTNSKILFIVFLFFWVFAGFLRLVNIELWAERSTIYAYQSLVIGVIMLIYESIRENAR